MFVFCMYGLSNNIARFKLEYSMQDSTIVITLDCTMVLYWNSSPIPQVKKFLHFDLTVTNGIPTPDFDQIEFDVQQGNKVGPAIILGILERSSMVHHHIGQVIE